MLCFLDDDTLPEPGYLTALTRLPASCPDALVTGRRRHVDLSGLDDAEVAAWLRGDRPSAGARAARARVAARGAPAQCQPAADRAGLAPLCHQRGAGLHRLLFDAVGGFDPGFDALRRRGLGVRPPRPVRRRRARARARGRGVARRAELGRTRRRGRAPAPEERRDGRAARPHPAGAGPRAAWTGRPDVVVEIGTDGEETAAVIVAVGSVLAGDVDAGRVGDGRPGAGGRSSATSPRDPRVHAGAVDDVAAASARVLRDVYPAATGGDDGLDPGCWDAPRLGDDDRTRARIVVDTGDGELVVTLTAAAESGPAVGVGGAVGRADRRALRSHRPRRDGGRRFAGGARTRSGPRAQTPARSTLSSPGHVQFGQANEPTQRSAGEEPPGQQSCSTFG